MRLADLFKRGSSREVEVAGPPPSPGRQVQRSISSGSWSIKNPPDWFVKWISKLGFGLSGGSMSHDKALTYSAFYAGVRIICEDLASCPHHIYERLDRGRRVAWDHPYYEMVHSLPNEVMNQVIFWETLQNHVLLRGNGYAYLDKQGGKVSRMTLLMPDDVDPVLYRGALWWKIKGSGSYLPVPDADIYHLAGLGYDGILGKSVIDYAKTSIELGINAEEEGNVLLGSRARIPGLFETEGTIDAEAEKQFENSWSDFSPGGSREGETPILPYGIKYKPIAISQKDAEYVETRTFQVNDMARWLRIPAYMISELSRATFSNIESQFIWYVTGTLRQWVVRREQELNRKLLGNDRRFYAEVDLNGLLRGDSAGRAALYKTLFDVGALTRDEIREKENMNPLPEEQQGSMTFVSSQVVPATKIGVNGKEKIIQ